MISKSEKQLSGLVFNIQRFSVHDGPGIRTTIFLKGCSLRCLWCQNPEGLRLEQDIQTYPDLCIGCGACVEACVHGARQMHDAGMLYLRDKCIKCGSCIETCYARATVLASRQMSVDEVMEEVLRDSAFYQNSGGGVTLSGGDPVVQSKFSRAILKHCKAAQIHTAIETAANCRWETLASFLPLTDLFMIDIKHMDTEKHRASTGTGNSTILKNIERLAHTDKPILFRVPVIPEFNDSREEITAIACFIQRLTEIRKTTQPSPMAGGNSISLELLPFHKLANDKYHSLGLNYPYAKITMPDRKIIEQLRQNARQCGVVVLGSASSSEH